MECVIEVPIELVRRLVGFLHNQLRSEGGAVVKRLKPLSL
jgi:hypothetical protein